MELETRDTNLIVGLQKLALPVGLLLVLDKTREVKPGDKIEIKIPRVFVKFSLTL